jgi:hypothetical protein
MEVPPLLVLYEALLQSEELRYKPDEPFFVPRGQRRQQI